MARAWLLLFACTWLGVDALSAPSVNVAAVTPATRTAEVSWYANNDLATFSGYRLTIQQTEPAPAFYIVQDESIDKSATSYAFQLGACANSSLGGLLRPFLAPPL
eukprot:4856030-Prymnesium_polylepis.1